MKIKTAAQTANLGKAHAYLGHFAKAKHINRGHNTDPVGNLSDVRAQGGMPSDQQRERLHRQKVADAVKDAEAGITSPPIRELSDREKAVIKRVDDSKMQNIPVWSRP